MKKWLSRKLFAMIASIGGAYMANKGLDPAAADKVVELIKWVGGLYITGQSFVDAGGLGGIRNLLSKEK